MGPDPSIKGLTFELDNASENLTTFKDLLVERRIKRFRLLATILAAEDDLGKIVRSHNYIENELQEFIFFAAPNPTHLKFDGMEFAEKVRLALILGLNSDLKPPLSAAGTLRNKFAHRLDMKIGQDETKILVSTFTPHIKQRFQALLQSTLSELPDVPKLKGEGLSYFKAQSQLMVFFLQLYEEMAKERHRIAFDKLQGMAWH
jgi:hypothetical protein